jgi:hypothetical protein
MNLKIDDLLVFINNINLSEYGYGMNINTEIGDSIEVFGYPAEGGDTMSNFNGEVLKFEKNRDGRILKIVTSARITPGQSGGGAYDKNGKFLGVTSAYYHENGKFLAGIIIPVTTVNWWIQEEQGYRINKDGEYTILSAEFEEAVKKALDLINGNVDSTVQNKSVLGVKINSTVEDEKKLLSQIDNGLSKKMSGNILLQVENHGEAWYVNPKNSKKYYMANGDEAYNIMRDLGVGITNKNLERIKIDKSFAKKHSGNIFLQVEANGEAYYIDFEGNLVSRI